MKAKTFLFLIIILMTGFMVQAGEQGQNSEPGSKLRKCFLYTAKKFGVPILKATIEIGNGSVGDEGPYFQVHANINSFRSPGWLFRMNNTFTSTIERKTFFPVRFQKEIDQGGLLIRNKNYIQTFTFVSSPQKVVVEEKGEDGKQEIFLPPETYDPLSMFVRYYLKDELRPGEDIRMSLFDGVKLRQMVFHSRKEQVRSKLYGEVEAVCLESTTLFSTFGDKEGIICIWYTNDSEKIPILMELDLPMGSVKFELEEVKDG